MKRSFKISIRIHPFFWLFAALIGFLMSGNILGALFWIVVIFVSVVVHEFGHAIMAVIFKQKPKIELVAMGGVTSYQGDKLKYYQQFLIVLNGPVFGFLLAGFAYLLLKVGVFQKTSVINALRVFQLVNIFWSSVNLIPVLPLDGGQLLRILLEGIFGIKGFKLSLIFGFIIAFIIALVAFVMRFYLLGALFFLFAFQSLDVYRRYKNIKTCDRDDLLADKLKEAQDLLQQQRYKEAQQILLDLRQKTKEGLIFTEATRFLAFISLESKENQKAYEYLLSIKDKLADEAICVLHKLAFENNNYSLVKKLSSQSYKINPTQEIALINARSFAILKEAKNAGGWLKTAIKFGGIELNKIINESYFQQVKNNSNFIKFFK